MIYYKRINVINTIILYKPVIPSFCKLFSFSSSYSPVWGKKKYKYQLLASLDYC
jgi:hypothetical protein